MASICTSSSSSMRATGMPLDGADDRVDRRPSDREGQTAAAIASGMP
jgi:hypothetical protein